MISSRIISTFSPLHSCMLRHLIKLANIILKVSFFSVCLICDKVASGRRRYFKINLSISCAGISLDRELNFSSAIDGYWEASPPGGIRTPFNITLPITITNYLEGPCSKFQIFVIYLDFSVIFFQYFGKSCENENAKEAIYSVFAEC